MILIATWLKGQNYPNERPSLIYWADGTVTTHEDYVRDLDCTHTGIMNPDGSMQMIFLPDLSGAVSYDTVERVWKVRPQVKPFSWIWKTRSPMIMTSQRKYTPAPLCTALRSTGQD
jgi:hypothetical protein